MKLQKTIATFVLIGTYALFFWVLPVWVEPEPIMGWELTSYSEQVMFIHAGVISALALAGLCVWATITLMDEHL